MARRVGRLLGEETIKDVRDAAAPPQRQPDLPAVHPPYLPPPLPSLSTVRLLHPGIPNVEPVLPMVPVPAVRKGALRLLPLPPEPFPLAALYQNTFYRGFQLSPNPSQTRTPHPTKTFPRFLPLFCWSSKGLDRQA